ncbi:MAG: hypothetical protein ACI97A_001841 [Planctomycetota bacterium]|jgi:hypothetical protein
MSENKSPRPGSARAKLEAFDRQNKGRDAMMKKLMITVGFLVLVLLFLFFMSDTGPSRKFFDLPKDVAWMIRDGEWDKLRDNCADDFRVDGTGITSADAFIKFLQSHGEKGSSVFSTRPHIWVNNDDEAVVEFWGVWARGDLQKKETIPLIRTWRIECRMVLEDKEWKLKRAQIRPSLVDDSKSAIDVEDLIDKK